MSPRYSIQTNVLDESLDVLSHRHRRRILTRLNARASRDAKALDVADLAADEPDVETLTLVHNHLPKLADSRFIDWDQERHVVTRGPRFHEIAPLIDLMVAHQDELPADWP